MKRRDIAPAITLEPLTEQERTEIKQMRAEVEKRGAIAALLIPLVSLLERAVATIEDKEQTIEAIMWEESERD